jgi:hypothetical protein
MFQCETSNDASIHGWKLLEWEVEGETDDYNQNGMSSNACGIYRSRKNKELQQPEK